MQRIKKSAWRILALCLIVFLLLGGVLFCCKTPIQKKYYPLEYKAEVLKAAETYDLPPALLFAVIRTESSFQKEAVSSVGAMGLTQIMPETFEWLQKKKKESYPKEALFEPNVSIDYGAYFYKILLDKYDGDVVTAAAAYHSGTGQVAKWLKDANYSENGKTLSQIPGKNAKHYADKILKAMQKYQKIYEKELEL